MQMMPVRNGVKLLACLKAKPAPDVRWFHNGKDISKYEFTQTHRDGVVTLEIPSCSVDDAGSYTCRATNSLGEAETTGQVIIEGVYCISYNSLCARPRAHLHRSLIDICSISATGTRPTGLAGSPLIRQLSRAASQPPGAPLSPTLPAENTKNIKTNKFYRERSRDRGLPRQHSRDASGSRDRSNLSASTRRDYSSFTSGPGFSRSVKSSASSTHRASHVRSEYSNSSK